MLPFVFRRQHPVEAFFVDFYCASARLVIEVDGPVHETRADDDRQRQEYLESLGLRVLRFSNADVFTRLDAVVDEIRQVCSNPDTSSGAER